MHGTPRLICLLAMLFVSAFLHHAEAQVTMRVDPSEVRFWNWWPDGGVVAAIRDADAFECTVFTDATFEVVCDDDDADGVLFHGGRGDFDGDTFDPGLSAELVGFSPIRRNIEIGRFSLAEQRVSTASGADGPHTGYAVIYDSMDITISSAESVPEPTSEWLLVSSIAGLGAFRRQKFVSTNVGTAS